MSTALVVVLIFGIATMSVTATVGVRTLVFGSGSRPGGSARLGLGSKFAVGSVLFYAGAACVIASTAQVVFP